MSELSVCRSSPPVVRTQFTLGPSHADLAAISEDRQGHVVEDLVDEDPHHIASRYHMWEKESSLRRVRNERYKVGQILIMQSRISVSHGEDCACPCARTQLRDGSGRRCSASVRTRCAGGRPRSAGGPRAPSPRANPSPSRTSRCRRGPPAGACLSRAAPPYLAGCGFEWGRSRAAPARVCSDRKRGAEGWHLPGLLE